MTVEIIADPGATWRIPDEPYDVSWDRCRRLLDATVGAGAQTCKWQYYTADGLYERDTPLWHLLKPYELPAEWLPRLKQESVDRGLTFMATVYTPTDVPTIAPLVDRFKVASFENGHDKLRQALLVKNKPVLVSLGMGKGLAPHEWKGRAIPLHCVSAYPAPPDAMNLRRIFEWNYDPGDSVNDRPPEWDTERRMGFSDHSVGNEAAVIAVAYGVEIIEKHLRAEDTPPTNPDYPHSASPAQFREYVAAIRRAEVMLGDGEEKVMPGEAVQWRYNPKLGKRGQ